MKRSTKREATPKTESAPNPTGLEPMDPSAEEVKRGAPIKHQPRLAYGLKTLIDEVYSLFPEVSHEATDFSPRGVALGVAFHSHETPEKFPELLQLLDDPRISEVLWDSQEDVIHVLLHGNPRTRDGREPYGLAEAWAVLSGEED